MDPHVPLWTKSNVSFLEGASHPEELIERAHELGLTALALTDRDGVHGVPRAHVRAEELGVKLIVGAQVTLLKRGVERRDLGNRGRSGTDRVDACKRGMHVLGVEIGEPSELFTNALVDDDGLAEARAPGALPGGPRRRTLALGRARPGAGPRSQRCPPPLAADKTVLAGGSEPWAPSTSRSSIRC